VHDHEQQDACSQEARPRHQQRGHALDRDADGQVGRTPDEIQRQEGADDLDGRHRSRRGAFRHCAGILGWAVARQS